MLSTLRAPHGRPWLSQIEAHARAAGAVAAPRERGAHPAAAPGAGAAPAAARLGVLAQATLEAPQVQSGRADGGAAAALARPAHEAAPARPPAERARDSGGAAAARSHCRSAADDGAGTPGSGARGAGSGPLGSASQPDTTAGAGPHAGGPCAPAACSSAEPQSAAGPHGMQGAGCDLALHSLLTERGGPFLCAVALAVGETAGSKKVTLLSKGTTVLTICVSISGIPR
jgi:hypothetical protein